MTTSQLIKKLNDLAKVGIVNAKEDTEVLKEAADRLYELRAKADPRWSDWLIMDEGAFLADIGQDGECEMTDNKDDAVSFAVREEAEEYLQKVTDLIGGGSVVLRGDIDSFGLKIFFNAGC